MYVCMVYVWCMYVCTCMYVWFSRAELWMCSYVRIWRVWSLLWLKCFWWTYRFVVRLLDSQARQVSVRFWFDSVQRQSSRVYVHSWRCSVWFGEKSLRKYAGTTLLYALVWYLFIHSLIVIAVPDDRAVFSSVSEKQKTRENLFSVREVLRARWHNIIKFCGCVHECASVQSFFFLITRCRHNLVERRRSQRFVHQFVFVLNEKFRLLFDLRSVFLGEITNVHSDN